LLANPSKRWNRARFSPAAACRLHTSTTPTSPRQTRRIDPRVNFGFSGEPVAGVGSDFSARWSGNVQPHFTEQYRFITMTSGGVRLWINGSLIIDDWNSHATTVDSGFINLTSEKKYSVRMEYFSTRRRRRSSCTGKGARQTKEIVRATGSIRMPSISRRRRFRMG